jgi:hypothetical protein
MKFLCFLLFVSVAMVFANIPEKSLWPLKTTLKADAVFEKKMPNGFLKFSAKAGQEVDLLSVEESDLLVSCRGVSGKVSIADTDFLEQCQAKQDKLDAEENARLAALAIEARLKNESDARKQAEIAAVLEFKKKPPVFSFDPISRRFTKPENLQKLVELVFRDPESFKLRDNLQAQVIDYKGRLAWQTIWHYGARNGFGGYNAGMIKFIVQDAKIVDYELMDKK